MINRILHIAYGKWFNKALMVLAICYMPLAIIGCGYTTRSMISSEYRTIYIAPFVNLINITSDADAQSKYKIYKPLLESDITRAVVDKYLFDGNLKPVEKANADLYLKGELVDFRREPLRYTDQDDVQEYRISISVNLKLINNKTGVVIWTEDRFTGESTYFVSGRLAKSDTVGVNDAIADLARRVVERTVEEW